MSGRGIIAQEPEQMCEYCNRIDECRPYGDNGEQICFDCATSTPERTATAERRMREYIFGEKQ
jgi:hypothetical protein